MLYPYDSSLAGLKIDLDRNASKFELPSCDLSTLLNDIISALLAHVLYGPFFRPKYNGIMFGCANIARLYQSKTLDFFSLHYDLLLTAPLLIFLSKVYDILGMSQHSQALLTSHLNSDSLLESSISILSLTPILYLILILFTCGHRFYHAHYAVHCISTTNRSNDTQLRTAPAPVNPPVKMHAKCMYFMVIIRIAI